MKINTNYRFWSQKEIQTLIDLCGKMSFEEMSEKHFENRTPVSLQRKSFKMGLFSEYRHRIHSHNKDYWKSNSLKTAYFAGQVATDGNLCSSHCDFRWVVSSKDHNILEEFVRISEFTGAVRRVTRKETGKAGQALTKSVLTISGCKEWYKDLNDIWSITPAKTFTLKPPNITNLNQKFAFWKGTLDGDGWITPRVKRRHLTLGIVSASPHFLYWFKELCDEHFPLSDLTRNDKLRKLATVNNVKANKNCYTYIVTGVRASVIVDFLKQVPTPYLKRKWDNPETLKIIEYHKSKWPGLFKTFDFETEEKHVPI